MVRYKVAPFTVTIYQHGNRRVYSPKLEGLSAKDVEVLRRGLCELEKRSMPPQNLPASLGDFIAMVQTKAAPFVAEASMDPKLASRLLAYEYVGLARLMPLIEDESVDEVFLDDPSFLPYIEHRTQGRCDYEYQLGHRELQSIRTHAEVYGGISASYRTPSVKTELHIAGFKIRVGLDVRPVAYSGYSLHLRKVGGNALTLTSLAKLNCVPIVASSILLSCMQSRLNVTIVGSSGSGKTTLLNALDMSLDPRLRRVYIEDAVESLDLSAWGYRQLKLRVPPIESGVDDEMNKMREVLKTLHRSPDILVLGEVQDESHSMAMFQAAEAGITGIQTFHSYSPEQAIRRWTSTHSIKAEQLADLGVLATMARPSPFSPTRELIRISAFIPADELVDLYSKDGGIALDCIKKFLREKGLDPDAFLSLMQKNARLLEKALLMGCFNQADFIEYVTSNEPVMS